ncbi:hypothetical protein [Ethanoligenens sp.]|uniref:DUF7657 domain-containing protein n=1 Tax=Ethanoligenens sp. TaxID=2099655 RepID=UPI0039E824D2
MEIGENFFRKIVQLPIKDFVKQCIKYRYLLALILFVILTVCKVNGSSISMWNNYIPSDSPSSVLLGKARAIRSDEWLVQTPYDLAQDNSDTPYSVVNGNITMSGQNMIVSYGSAVWDISTLAKPLMWGFLLFGSSYGLAWYWNLKLLLMLLLSFELCMMITRRNQLISVLGSFWIAFSPAIQWWFMQHVGDIVFYMEALVVLFYTFFRYFNRPAVKIACAVGFGLSCVGYALTLYPALQVPLGYLTLLLLIMVFIGFRKKVVFSYRDYILISCAAIMALGILLHVYLISKDAIAAIVNTSYPGHRVSTGGEGLPYSINVFLTNVFLPFKDIPPAISNNCESSSFYNFLPAVLLAIPFLVKHHARHLRFGISLSVFSLLCIAYNYLHVPVWFAKITLLSYVTAHIGLAYAFSAMLLSIWALSELCRLAASHRISPWLASVFCAGIAGFYFLSVYDTQLKAYVRLRYYIAFILVLLVLNYLLLRGLKWLFSVVMFGVVMVSGTTVNPINVGLGGTFHSELTVQIRKIRDSDRNANWIANNNSCMGSFLQATGVRDLDGINFYPDMKKWTLIDPKRKYISTYNRYAHINVQLTKDPTSFSLLQMDSIQVSLNVDDLQKWQVKYLLTTSTLEAFDDAEVQFLRVTPQTVNGYYIYQTVYR